MIIEIALSDSQKEWCILEFQGEILGDLEENTLGEIEIKNSKKAEMTIGQHFLEGTIVTLIQPFLVTEKCKHGSNDSTRSSNSDERTEQSESSYINIVGVARKKIMFTTRPKPLGLKKK
eukprot:gene36347-48957_t